MNNPTEQTAQQYIAKLELQVKELKVDRDRWRDECESTFEDYYQLVKEFRRALL